MRTRAQTCTRSWQSFYPTDTNTHLHTGPPAVELTQTKKLSCVQLQTHTRPYTSISSSCDKSEKSAAERGVRAVQGKGGQIVSGKSCDVSSTGKWFPFHETERGMYINTAALISPWQHREMACCDKTMWGEKHRGIFWGKADIFFTALNFTRVNKSPKERRIKSTPQTPQFSKTHGPGEWLTRLLLVCGMARWLTEYQERWHLLKFFNAALFVCLFACAFVLLLKKKKETEPSGTEEEADRVKEMGVV